MLLDPGRAVLDIERDDLAETRDLVLERLDGSIEQIREQAAVERAQRCCEPLPSGQGLLEIEAEGLGKIEDKVQAEFEHEPRMVKEKLAELSGVNQAIAAADEKGFQVGGFGVSRPTARG